MWIRPNLKFVSIEWIRFRSSILVPIYYFPINQFLEGKFRMGLHNWPVKGIENSNLVYPYTLIGSKAFLSKFSLGEEFILDLPLCQQLSYILFVSSSQVCYTQIFENRRSPISLDKANFSALVHYHFFPLIYCTIFVQPVENLDTYASTVIGFLNPAVVSVQSALNMKHLETRFRNKSSDPRICPKLYAFS